MNKSNISVAAVFSLILSVQQFSSAQTGAAPDRDKLSRANELYSAGDCQKAVVLYGAVQSELKLDEGMSQQVLFKKSYCHLNLKQYDLAERGFSAYLKKDPQNSEALLRLAEVAFDQGHYEKSRSEALKVKSAEYVSEARIFAARSDLELGHYELAIKELNSIQDAQWKPVVAYWKGIAQYRSDENDLALSEFQTANSSSTSESWVKAESQSWIDKIKKDTRWVSGYITVGALSDSNVAQSSTGNLKGGGGGPGSDSRTPPTVTDSTAISDKGSWFAAGLSVNPYTTYSKSFSFDLSFSTPNYSTENKSYNYRSYLADVSSNFRTDAGDWWGVKLEYLKSYYDTTESESYLIFDPYYSWNVNSDWSLKFLLTYNKYLKTTKSSVITPAVSTYYGLSSTFGLKGSLSYAIGQGEQAVYTNATPPAVASGTMFSNYSTYGATLGYWWQIQSDLEFSGQASYSKTSYKHEDAAPPANSPAPDDRSDTLTQYSFDLLYTVIPSKWTFDLSATISNNKSKGYQGVPTYGSFTTYTYDRKYYMLTTTWSF